MIDGGLYLGDCLEIMPLIADESIDLILCDLPYGTTASAWDTVIPIAPLWDEYRRILKPRGTIALFCVQPFTSQLVLHGLRDRLHYRYMWVWIKNIAGNHGNAHKMPLRAYEEIAIFGKTTGKYNPQGLKKLDVPILHKPKPKGVYRSGSHPAMQHYTGYPRNVLKYDVKNGTHRHHPNEKPEELLRYLIRTYTDAGDMVLDNTMGSGSTCVAAVLEGRSYIGIERDERYYNTACARVAEAERQAANDAETT